MKRKLFASLIILLVISSCKPVDLIPQETSSNSLIADAKLHFEKNVLNKQNSVSAINDLSPRQRVNKTAIWKKAKIRKVSNGEAVIVPIEFSTPLYTKIGSRQELIALDSLTYLMLYKNNQGGINTEVITTYPGDEYWGLNDRKSTTFEGIVVVEDWKNNFIKSYAYNKNGSVYNLKPSITNSQTNNIKETTTNCYNVYYQACGPNGESCDQWSGYDTYCTYTTTGDLDPNSVLMMPTDYTGGGSTTYVLQIKNELNNYDADCIFNKLLNNTFFSTTLASFKNSANLNVTFKMGSPVDQGVPVDAQTHHDYGTTDFTITMGKSAFEVNGGVENAKTFMHEAIHANLWISAKEWYGTSLPLGFQNLTLVEQVKWLDAKGGNGGLHHEYMAANINSLASALQAYVQANYPLISSNSNIGFNSYKAMAFRGLKGTNAYNDFLSSLPGDNKQITFDQLYVDLTYNGAEIKCP